MIRPAVPGDVEALSDLAQRTWADAFASGVDDVAAAMELRSAERFRAALQKKTILVAEEAAKLVGYVQFDDAELQRLYVETALHGRAIGRRLLAAALEHPRLANAGRVWLQVWEENVRAVRLYESFGFRRAGSTSFTIGSQEMEDMVMVLERTGWRSMFMPPSEGRIRDLARALRAGANAKRS